VRQAVGPSGRPVRIFVTDARLDRLSLYAAAVRSRQLVSPTIWLVTGDPFADTQLKSLTDGDAQVSLLSRAGVDAVVLTPAWLAFGLPRLDEMVSKGRFYALSASLLDASGQTIGYPFMVRKSGSAILGVTGLALDSANILTHLAGVRYSAPGRAAGKAITLMRQRADLVGVMVEPRSPDPGWHADFTVNSSASGGFAMAPSDDPGRINCYDVSADAGRLIAKTVDLGQLKPDSSTARLLDSVRMAADSQAARSIPLPRGPLEQRRRLLRINGDRDDVAAVRTDAGRLASTLIQGILAAKLADGFLCDSLFVADYAEPKDVGTLVGLLRDPGRLATIAVQGSALAGWPGELVLRPGLTRAGLSRGLTYRIATTVDYIQRHPELASAGFELASRPFWTMCLDILESGRVK
jgi:hypothetical protein